MQPLQEDIITENQVRALLAQIKVPYLERDLITAGLIKSVVVTEQQITLNLQLNYLWPTAKQVLSGKILAALQVQWPQIQLDLNINQHVRRHSPQNDVKSLPSIKNIIAVASGKGGVGKSTVAVNLALSLQRQGARVGLLDSDIYGPSQPQMLGVSSKPVINEDKTIEPIIAHGLQTMSIGYLINADTPAVWRGPMVSGALQQMLTSTAWQDLDYLIIDLPPGTGDVQLTLAQKVPVCGAVIVTTPQDVALLDVTKAISMFTRVKVPILGVVENMGLHICSNCGQQEHIFGSDGGARLANLHQTRLLGQLPLERKICDQGDRGVPLVVAEPDASTTEIYMEIAYKVAAQLSQLPRDLNVPLRNIVTAEV